MFDYTLNYLYNGDCRELLKTYPDNFFDCFLKFLCARGCRCLHFVVDGCASRLSDFICPEFRCISDVPYKLVTGGASVKNVNSPCGILNRRVNDPIKQKWLKQGDNANADDAALFVSKGKLFENCDIKFEEWLPEVYRVMKNGTHIYFMVNGRNFKELQIKAEKAGFIYQNTLVWVKQNATPNHYYMQKCEFILMLRKGSARDINDFGAVNVFTDLNPIGNKFHPTEKPVSLMKKLIENSTNEGDIVLEPFAGAGSTLLAAKETGRNYIGSEIDKKYYDIAIARLNGTAHRMDNIEQIKLFGACQ